MVDSSWSLVVAVKVFWTYTHWLPNYYGCKCPFSHTILLCLVWKNWSQGRENFTDDMFLDDLSTSHREESIKPIRRVAIVYQSILKLFSLNPFQYSFRTTVTMRQFVNRNWTAQRTHHAWSMFVRCTLYVLLYAIISLKWLYINKCRPNEFIDFLCCFSNIIISN